MKMASLSSITVLLLCCFVSAGSSDVCEMYAPTGGSVTLPLGYSQKFRTLKWKFETDIIYYNRQSTQDNLANVNEKGDLIRTNLMKNQEGLYKPEVFDENGKTQTVKSTYLCVRDPVKKPKIKFTCPEQNVIFTCQTADQNASLEWLWNGGVIKNELKTLLKKTAEKTKNVKISCKVSNEVSSEISDTTIHNCIKEVIPGLPNELYGVSIWIFVGGGGGVVLLLIIIVIVCCIRSKRRKGVRLKDEEELRLDWTNNQQQNHHHHLPPLPDQHPSNHHHHQQQQQAGNTGPRQGRCKQQRNQRPRAPEPSEDKPQPKPRRNTQAPKPAGGDDEHPPPLPQPRKKVAKTQME